MAGSPPFDFENVVLRVFPLRADIHALRLFCDRFLNIAHEYALFEPAAPYVFLEVINYGRMSAEASNFGWVSQNEVAFAVLLNWYDTRGGKPVFHDTASVCPFIFVDEETSVRGGREVFGWPKSLAWLTPGIDAWTRDPRSPRTLFTLSAMVFPELFAGQRQETRVLFEIAQEPELSAAEFPIDPANQLNPMVSLPRTVVNSLRLAGEMAQNLTRLPIQGFPQLGLFGPRGDERVAGADFRTAPPWEMLRNAFGGMNPFAQLPAFNTINLKQFRDSAKPEEVCYQALVNAKMSAKSLKRGGLLGQPAMALGDPSGGYTLKLHRYQAWPIIESLGLEVASEATERGSQVATIKPVMPNWMECDFHYGTGDVICWRSCQTDWAPPPREQPVDMTTSGCPPWPDPHTPPDRSRPPERPCRPHQFNTAQGGSLDQVRGPFHFPDVTMRILPLLAEETKLQEFCDDYLNHCDTAPLLRKARKADGEVHDWRLEALAPKDPATSGLPNNMFRAWGDHVYMVVSSFEEMTSELNVGWWARRQVLFAFPVKWYRRTSDPKGGPDQWQLVSFALVSPFIYADSSVAATTGREMQGRPVVKAEIDAPSSAWLDRGGPERPEEYLKLSADVYPALNVNQKIERRELIEITGRDVLRSWETESWQQLASGANGWGGTLVAELEKKQRAVDDEKSKRSLTGLKGMALEILAGRRPVNHISLKQFRDAEDPNRACYQAITLCPETLERIYDLREIDDRLHVAIHRYPSQPIVGKLGLKIKWTDEARETVVDYLQPIRPFWLRASVRADLGHDIFWRAGGSTWRPSDLRLICDPRGAVRPPGTEFDEIEDPLFFERAEPKQFGFWEADWVERDPQNKRRLQDLGSKLTIEKLEAAQETRRQQEIKRLEEELRAIETGYVPVPAVDAEKEKADYRKKLEELKRPPGSARDIGIRAAAIGLWRVERHRLTPQIALESILSNEWLHFGRPRWERKKAAEGGEFDERIRALASGQEAEALGLGGQGALPLKRDFLIRRDTIGHPEIRAKFEIDNNLERLDDDYWYWQTDDDRASTKDRQKATRLRIWAKLEEAWELELAKLESGLDDLGSSPRELGPNLAEIEPRRKSLEELRASVKRHVAGARKSGELESEYRYIQKAIQDERSALDELESRCMQYAFSLLPMPPEPVEKSRRETGGREGGSGESGEAGKTKEVAETTAPIPLEPGIIKGLGRASLEVLADHGIETVQDLLKPEAKSFHNWLRNVSARSAVRMLEEAESIVARATRKR